MQSTLPTETRRFSTCLALALLSVVLAACSRTDEEAAIRQLIAEGAQRAEAHDLGGLMALSTEDFVAEPGPYPRTEAKRFLFVGLKRYGNFRIHYPRPAITLSEDRRQATATLHFLIVNRDRLFPELEVLYDDPAGWLAAVDANADLFTLALDLRGAGEDWQVRRARLTRFAGLRGDR